jgi:acetyl esterase/lipase
MIMTVIAAAALGVGRRLLSLPSRVRRRARYFFLPIWTRTLHSILYGPQRGQEIDIMRPCWPMGEARTVAAVFHGGGWRDGCRADMIDRVCRRYLERGFIVVNVGYRCAGVVPASEDAISAIEWIFGNIASYGGDSGRIFVTGESAGAHLALLAAFSCHKRVRGVVAFYGVTDLTSFPGVEKDPSLPTKDLYGTLRRLSPIHIVRPDLCPVLSIHGTVDEMVSLDQTSRLTQQLQKAGVRTNEIIIEGGGHGFPEHQLDTIYDRIFKFLEPLRW